MDFASFIFIALIVVGFFMAMGVGANDVANAMGTSVGSKALTIKQAIIIAAVFELAGAILAGESVTNTLSKNIIHVDNINDSNIILYGMFSCSISSAIWLLFASYKGFPVSTTHTIIGSLVGFALFHLGPSFVNWNMILTILLSWIAAPIISMGLSYLFFMSVKKSVFDAESPYKNAQYYIPCCVGVSSFFLLSVILKQVLKSYFKIYDFYTVLSISFPISIFFAFFSYFWIRSHSHDLQNSGKYFEIIKLEELFKFLMVFTAISMAFAHGANDVSNAIGPLSSVVSVLQGSVINSANAQLWVLILGGVGIVFGLMIYGYKVMITIGNHITELTPSRGYAAELSTAGIVMVASAFGLPVSSTQTLVGAILGVGLARGIGAINPQVITNIILTWIVTLPISAILSSFIYFLITNYVVKLF